jgi:hypothetical protein
MYINVETLEYPISQRQITLAMPDVSFPVPFSPPNGFMEILATPKPENSDIAMKVVEGVPVLGENYATQTWKIVKCTTAEKKLAQQAEVTRVVDLRASLKAAATTQRWKVETGGVLLPNGVKVKTDTDDQDRITATVTAMEAVGMESVDFKADTGWVTLTLSDIQSIRAVIAYHVQACFSAERAHHEAIDALPESELVGYDVTQYWPVQGSV